jgi:acetylornithine/N-succinyldiaminopimelate aminotransferase
MATPTQSRRAKRLSPAAVLRAADRYLASTYKRPPRVFTHGKGAILYDHGGRGYLDFLGGIAVNALGYAHPRLTRVLRREAGRATHVSNLFHNRYQGPLAAKLALWSGMDRAFFTNSGAEAVEAAMKLARAYGRSKQGLGKTRFLALENSFHGRTFGALSLTWPEKYRHSFEPLVPGVEFVRFNDVADLEAKFSGEVCAIFIEPLQGEGGVLPVSGEFWRCARELATARGAALVADEIQCGLGRTGRRFAYQSYSGAPDIVTVAKPLAGGLPLGAMLAREEFAAAFTPGLHGSTFGGGPLACAVALEFLNVVEEQGLLANVAARGAELRQGLERLARQFECIVEIRGEGLMLGVELSVEGAPYVAEALKQGVLINCTQENTLRLLPPFIITSAQVRECLRRMESVFARMKRSGARAAASAQKKLSQVTPSRELPSQGRLVAAR